MNKKEGEKLRLEFCRIDGIKDDYHCEMEAMLRQRGWEHTSKTPGSFWMWRKDCGGDYGVIMAPTEIAFNMESSLCYLNGVWDLPDD